MAGGEIVPCFCACLAALTLVAVLVAEYAFVVPVRVTVDAATLGSLALAEPAVPANDGTASVAYDVSVEVALRNRNWAMAVSLTAPLVAELRFRGHAFARAQLAPGDRAWIHGRRTVVYSMAGVSQSAPVALGPGGAAEFARERAAGVFELELAVSGEVMYEAHTRRRAIRVTCPLKLSPSTAPAAFAKVRCT
ncbi:hypothetical protein SEVIR_2G288650v4 [Setaria viridis]|nr:uncharacterized protein LOC117846528 [Setaria viridis]